MRHRFALRAVTALMAFGLLFIAGAMPALPAGVADVTPVSQLALSTSPAAASLASGSEVLYLPYVCDHCPAPNFWAGVLADASVYYDHGRDEQSGLVRDYVMVDNDGRVTKIADYTKIPNVALHLQFESCVSTGATSVEWESPAESRVRILRILQTLERMERWEGALFYDWYTLGGASVPQLGARRIVSTVENGELSLAAATVIGALGQEGDTTSQAAVASARRLLATQNYLPLYRHPHLAAEQTFGYWLDRLVSESRAASMFAILHSGVPDDAWLRLERPWRLLPVGSVATEPVYLSWNGAPQQFFWPLIYFDEETMSPGLAASLRRTLAIYLKHSRQGGAWLFPDPGVDPNSSDYRYVVTGLRDLAEDANTRELPVVSLHALALAAMLDDQTMAQWAVDLLLAFPQVDGPWGWRDSLDPKTKNVARFYSAVDQGLLINSIQSACVRENLAHYLRQDQFATMRRLYRQIPQP